MYVDKQCLLWYQLNDKIYEQQTKAWMFSKIAKRFFLKTTCFNRNSAN